MTTCRSRTLSVTIDRSWQDVYAFAADPAKMTRWAAGLGSDFAPETDNVWVARQEGKAIRVHFTPTNALGVLDHDVHVGDAVVHVACRVMPNGDGAEVTFLLLQERGMTDEEFERDAALVQKDLDLLRSLLEAR